MPSKEITGDQCVAILDKLIPIVQPYICDTDGYPDPVEPDPNPETKVLTGYKFGKSDYPTHLGQYYFIPPDSLLGDIENVIVGATHYKVDKTIPGYTAVYYGPPSTGKITVRTKDGTIYISEKTEGPGQPGSNKEMGGYHGRHNGDRPTWYFDMRFEAYPSPLYVTIPGCGIERKRVDHDGHRYDQGGLILKQSDVPGRGLAIVMSASCKSEVAYIEY